MPVSGRPNLLKLLPGCAGPTSRARNSCADAAVEADADCMASCRAVGRDCGGGGGETVAKTSFVSVDAYIAAQPEDVQAILQRVRGAIRRAMPEAEEAISYQIPAYKLAGHPVLYFAAWKAHFSLYPASAPLVAALKAELAPYALSKGTIRFPLGQAVPVRLIQRIARFRKKEAAERAGAKPKRKAAAAKGRRARAR